MKVGANELGGSGRRIVDVAADFHTRLRAQVETVDVARGTEPPNWRSRKMGTQLPTDFLLNVYVVSVGSKARFAEYTA